jgi:hypothetical protein
LPPAGVSTSRLRQVLVQAFGEAGDQLLQWLAVDEPTWGRTSARRLEAVAELCKKAEASGNTPPT